MIEFTIYFKYDNSDQKARVIKSYQGDITEYIIRPQGPTIVQTFGKQIIIFKNNDTYNCNNCISKDYPAFFNSLVAALQELSIPELNF